MTHQTREPPPPPDDGEAGYSSLWWPALIVAGYVLLATAFAALVPPLEAPDETGHLFYVNYVARTLRLPVQDDPDRSVEGEGHQFPLYYVLSAGPVRATLADDSVDLLPRPNRTPGAPPPAHPRPKFIHTGTSIFASPSDARAFYLLRGLSILLGAGTVVAAWFVAGELLPYRGLRFLATIAVATLPQFVFISASINNDNLCILLVTLSILFLFRLSREPTTRIAICLGVSLGLALATKKTALFLVPIVVVVIADCIYRERGQRLRLAARLAPAPALAIALSGSVFARNQRLYGDPLTAAMERRTLPSLVDEKSVLDRYWWETFAPRLGESFVGVFGWMDVPLPPVIHLGYLLLAVVGGIGVALGLRRARDRRPQLISIALIASCLAGVVVYNLTYTQYQGRFMLPVVSVVAALMIGGLNEALNRSGITIDHRIAAYGLVAWFLVANGVALIVIYNFYSPANHYV